MKNSTLYLLLGGGALAALLVSSRKALTDLATALFANPEAFASSISSEAEPYAAIILQVAQEQGVDPLIIAALGQQESRWGQALTPPGPSGTGDSGHGRGIMQIDDRTWGDWLNSSPWQDPYSNVTQGAIIYLQGYNYLANQGLTEPDLTPAALAGYNAGPGTVLKAVNAGNSPDSVTTNGNYSSSVLGYYASYSATASNALGVTA